MRRSSQLMAAAIMLAAAAVAFGQQTAGTNAPADPAPSAAEDDSNLRDPFWPVGYAPKAPEPVEPPPSPTPSVAEPAPNVAATPVAAVPPPPIVVKWPTLKLKGLIKSPSGDKYVAHIEGIGIVESGRIVRIKQDGVEFSWKIGEITEKGVEITPIEAKPGN